MLPFLEDIDLLPYNTFKIKVKASAFVAIKSVAELQYLLTTDNFRKQRRLILGGGSNVLLTQNFEGLVIKNEIKGIEVVDEDDDKVILKIGSGENWHETVMYCVDHGYGGLENLSLIPGTMGAAPMQNIGAYGVEVKETLVSVQAVELKTGQVRTFTNTECRFGYRESIFKHELKDQYFISSVTLTLTKRNHHINITYGAIKEVLIANNVTTPTIKTVSDAVISIRKSKLPDPAIIGNAGSFFKNPSLDTSAFNALKKDYPAVPSFAGENGFIKVPAAWLIEQCGWKGKTLDRIGVHKQQALVLVNYGGGDGRDIWQLAMDIQQSVRERFGILLHPEVNVV